MILRTYIKDKTMLDAFLYRVDGFHDALIHEAVLLNTGYVDETGAMYGDLDLPNVRLRIQSQFDDVIGVEIDLIGVSILSLVFDRQLQMEAEISKDAITLYPCGSKAINVSQIRAKRIRYRMLGIESRGPLFELSQGIADDLIEREDV